MKNHRGYAGWRSNFAHLKIIYASQMKMKEMRIHNEESNDFT
ncbi:hypothetical protein ACXYMZ_09495 [Oceanobacillus sp. CAU 1775]